ncbi:response regulator FixJ [Legionella birminghamensis]|uniref:Response regulator FixJ n=1 Tax=Legionella birminghamensis TaxID=28083 RepID=A0A378IBH4_9GAMM|nr:helix-turn-helix transcriptional regulator [Legionella birminghamensis]KTC75998.1 response regulator FixJ [Legionella birminghamensis]STX32125.1 transcription regulator protein, response regulator containing CheY-like receiver domain and HTH DNA-binding domain [Legionella birminghamensis]
MSVILQTPIALSACEAVHALTIPQLIQHEITAFNYYRMYFDGTAIRFSSDRAWTEHFFKKDYLSKLTVPDTYLTEPVNYFIWLTEDCPEMLLDAAINFDTSNGISIAVKQDDSIEYFCFATNTNNKSIINKFYLGNLDRLHQYGLKFKEQAAGLLEQAGREKLIIRTADKSKMLSTSSMHQPRFSKRELECAFALLNGMRVKEIARMLGLSVRTIESYIQNMKNKLGCSSQIELVLKLANYKDFINQHYLSAL